MLASSAPVLASPEAPALEAQARSAAAVQAWRSRLSGDNAEPRAELEDILNLLGDAAVIYQRGNDETRRLGSPWRTGRNRLMYSASRPPARIVEILDPTDPGELEAIRDFTSPCVYCVSGAR